MARRDFIAALLIVVVAAALLHTGAVPASRRVSRRPPMRPNRDRHHAIGGVVTSRFGPEAGVWVIAETSDLGTRFAKMVVTDELGRYVMPDLPKANYASGCAATAWSIPPKVAAARPASSTSTAVGGARASPRRRNTIRRSTGSR